MIEARNSAEALFEETYKKLHNERVKDIIEQCRREAFMAVIGQYKSALNQRLVQVGDGGPYKLMYEFEAEIDSGTLVYYYDEEYVSHGLVLTLKENLKDNVPPVVYPTPFFWADPMLGPIFEDLAKRREELEKTSAGGKIILPENFYYFIWGLPSSRGKFSYDSVIQAKNFDEAKNKVLEKIPPEGALYGFKVFYDNRWYKL